MKKLVFFLLFSLPLISFAQQTKTIRPLKPRVLSYSYSYSEPKNSFFIFPNSFSRTVERMVDRIFDCDKYQQNYYGTILNRNGMEIIIRPRSPRMEINREIIERIRNSVRKSRGVRI